MNKRILEYRIWRRKQILRAFHPKRWFKIEWVESVSPVSYDLAKIGINKYNPLIKASIQTPLHVPHFLLSRYLNGDSCQQ